ncbi:hypothetical protein HDU85_000080 [Gaertneriomyces sp. JEL0708]|nr:hypothetical protein HDU85_000080 [Gaertneriomyces sp. JEL0708]
MHRPLLFSLQSGGMLCMRSLANTQQGRRLATGVTTSLPKKLQDIPILTKQLKDRTLAKLTLANGIRGVLISDPGTPTTGAALSVEAGSWRDGKHEGTAHFLEHMLFLGTKSYPKEYDYERFIYDSNGQLNGYTASDHSLYYFTSLTPTAFDGALDRFSKFFYEPLFNESCVDREMNAVHQEYLKNIEQDGWRILHVRKALSNPEHPFSGFNTGNLDTMKLINQEYLKDWFKKNYSANLMYFALLGRDPIEVLAQKAEKAFGRIPNNELDTLSTVGCPIFPSSLHGTLVWVEPIKNLRELTLSWEVPIEFADMATKPAALASHAIGYEGRGSLLSSLKRDELAEGLSAGKSHLGADNLLFEISVSLTDKGLKQWRDVVQRIFEAIESFKAEAYPKYLYDEINYIRKVGYQYQQRNADLATSYCGMLRKEGLETFPARSYFIEHFDATGVRALLDHLVPQSCMYMMVSQKSEAPLEFTEKWMGAKYGLQSLKAELTQWSATSASPAIKFPEPNRFVPTNLHLEERSGAPPQLLVDQAAGKMYFYPDDEFLVPEAACIFNIKTPAIRPDNAPSLVLASLYNRFVHERLNELSYDASSAGLHYDIWVHQDTGIAMQIDGYSEKALLLMKEVLERLRNPEFTEGEFVIFKESLLRSYKNAAKNPPVRQAMETVSETIYEQYCSSDMLAKAANDVTLDDLRDFSRTLFSTRYIEAFAGGNLTSASAMAAWELVLADLPGAACDPSSVQKSGVRPMTGDRPEFHTKDLGVKGNAVVWVCELGKKDVWKRTGQQLLAKLSKEPFYTELRTKQQTGYIVSSGLFEANKQLYLQAAVQSSTHDPRDLLARIELFQEAFLRDLVESADIESRFDSVKHSLLERLRQPYDTLASKLRFFNYLAYEEDANFLAISERIAALERFTLDDLRNFAKETVGRTNRHRLAVLAYGNDDDSKEFCYRLMTPKL